MRLSPENLPLRQALGDALLANGLAAEAVVEFKAALGLAKENAALKFGLAASPSSAVRGRGEKSFL